MSASIRFNSSSGPLQIAAGAVALANFNDTAVLGWHWELLDKPTSSASVISSAFASAPSFTADTPGSYRVRLRTYVDAARTVLDATDIQITFIRFPSPFVWRKPAAGETTEADPSRGWATARDEFTNDVQTYLQGGLQTAFDQIGTIELGGGSLVVTQAASPVFTFDGATGRARIPNGTLAAPALSFSGDGSSGIYSAGGLGKWSLVANNVTMIDFGSGAISFGARTYQHDGAVGTPGISFTADPDTGIYRITADSLGISTGGVLRLGVSTTGFDSTVFIRGVDGTAASPGFTFVAEQTTGMFRAGTALGLATAGAERVRFVAGTSTLVGHWVPSADLTWDLGTAASFRWNNLYVGAITATTVTATTYVGLPAAPGGVPTSRTITAGTGLTGGGDLTADRTLTVDIAGTSPLPIGTADPGASGKVSDRDHVHAHGSQTGPTNHALATKSAHGFLDSADYDRVIGRAQNQEIVFREEFEAGVPVGWTGTVTGAGATVALVVGGSTYGSLLRLYVGTTATGTAQLDRSLNHFYTNRFSRFAWEVKGFVSGLSTGAEEYDLFMCYSGINGVSLSYDRNTSLYWQTTRWAAGVPTHTVTTVLADTAMHSFGWVWTSAAGGTVTLSIDGVAVGVAYTGVTFAAVALTAARMVKSAGSVPPFAYLDFTEAVGTLATPRS